METHLALSPSGDLLGFYAIAPIEMNLSKDDSVIIRLRRLRKRNSDSRKQPALEVCWIARSAQTQRGFGHNLFDHAVINARRQDAVALVVRPHDMQADTLWRTKYHFRSFKDDRTRPDEPAPMLWYPVDELVVGSWPS